MGFTSLFDIWKNSCEKYSDLVAFSNFDDTENITYKEAFRELCFLSENLEILD